MAMILVVDDEFVMLSLTTRILSQKYEVRAAKSGEEAVRLCDIEKPDLVLTDLNMPDMSGFQLYDALHRKFGNQIPVVFMTGIDGDRIEKKGFEYGAADFIRKPFQASVLLRRVDNILQSIERIKGLAEEAARDSLTGFLNKGAVTERLMELCQTRKGILLVIDLDSFKLVNDLYGHEKGDVTLCAFADILRKNTRSADVCGRVGGDEFVCFCVDSTDRSAVAHICKRINTQFLERAKEILGEDMTIPLGVSVGASIVPDDGVDFNEVFNLADQALYTVKHNGKHSFAFSDEDEDDHFLQEEDLQSLNMIFEERNVTNGAYYIGRDAFTQVYRFFLRYVRTYKESAYTLLITLEPNKGVGGSFSVLSDSFGDVVGKSLRKSDIMVRIRQSQYLLLLPHVTPEHFDDLLERLLRRWKKNKDADLLSIRYESSHINPESEKDQTRRFEDISG